MTWQAGNDDAFLDAENGVGGESADAAVDEVVSALTAPPTAAELTGEEQAVAAFRAARARRSSVLLRTSVGAATTGLVLSITGAAAAYTGHLPTSVQRVAHHLLGRVGVPQPTAGGGVRVAAPAREGSWRRETASGARPGAETRHGTNGPAGRRRSGRPGQTMLTLVARRDTVTAGQRVVLTARLWTTERGPLVSRQLRLFARADAATAWSSRPLQTRTTDGDGLVSFAVTDVSEREQYVAVFPPASASPTGCVSSQVVTVSVAWAETLTADATTTRPGRDGVRRFTVAVSPHASGRRVWLQVYSEGVWKDYTSTVLSTSSTGEFRVWETTTGTYVFRTWMPPDSGRVGAASTPVRLTVS